MRETINAVRAWTVPSGGGDYHAQASGHWIDNHIASPMSRYPQYRETRSSYGVGVLGSIVVEVESGSGEVGVGVSTGGIPACWVVENHLSRFVEGRSVDDVELMWDQMFNATLHYGRKGIVLNAIGAIDLAIWDLRGRLRQEPVFALLGGPVRDELTFYATTSRPDLAKEMGFVGGKMPLLHAPAEGEGGFRKNVERAEQIRYAVGDDFWLMYDCYMALDVQYALRLIDAVHELGFRWVEESLPPDDYWGYAEVKRRRPNGIMVATGEHEATRWGFRMLLEMDCADIIQPDVTWCGGMTELIKISALAEAHNVLVVPHGSSVYGYHFVVTRHHSPFAEFLIMSPDAEEVVPVFTPLLLNEPVPENGRMRVPETPGFGVELNRDLQLARPFPR